MSKNVTYEISNHDIYHIPFQDKTALILFFTHNDDEKIKRYMKILCRVVHFLYNRKIQSTQQHETISLIQMFLGEILYLHDLNNHQPNKNITIHELFQSIEQFGGIFLTSKIGERLSNIKIMDQNMKLSDALYSTHFIYLLSKEFRLTFDYISTHLFLLKHQINIILSNPFLFPNIRLISDEMNTIETIHQDIIEGIYSFFGKRRIVIVRIVYSLFYYLPREDKMSFTFLSQSPIFDLLYQL